MPPDPVRLPTIGFIAAELHQPLHRVEYAVKSLGIEPIARAGGLRVFSDADIQRISAALSSRKNLSDAGEISEEAEL